MNKYCLLLLVFMASGVQAISCVQGCGNIYTTISKQFALGENNVNYQAGSSPVLADDINVKMERGEAYEVFQYAGGEWPSKGHMEGNWTFRRIDNYVSIGLRVLDPCYSSPVYAPFNIQGRIMNKGCIPYDWAVNTKATITQKFESRIRIDKKLMSGTYSRDVQVGRYYLCQTSGCVLLATVYLSLNIVVKESCVLNAGQMIDIDFDKIPVSAFKSAGQKAVGVRPAVRTLNVTCTNIDPNTNLSMRVEASKVSGNAIVSDNPDVGFVITGTDEKEITPNNIKSTIGFPLGEGSQSNVTIKVYPVSVTGNKPKEGAVVSTGYLRLDFD